MAHRPVMVVHQTFAFKDRIVERGSVIHDPEEIAFVRKHHPEKAVASRHAYDEPAPAPVAVEAPAPIIEDEPAA